VFVPINYKLHPREMEQILERRRTQVRVAKIAEGATVTTVPIEVIPTYKAASPTVSPPEKDHGNAGCSTPAAPRAKGAMLSHRNLIAMTVPISQTRFARRELQPHPRRTDVAWFRPIRPPTPRARQAVPASGAPEPDEFLDLVTPPGCSAFSAPTMVQRLVQIGRAPGQPENGGVRRRPDVRRQPEEGDGGARPDFRPALRPR
jgi:hypothetical protein